MSEPTALPIEDVSGDELRRDVEDHGGIAVLRGGGAERGWNGIRYRAVTAKGSRNPGNLSMN